jgi:hypothetical protein
LKTACLLFLLLSSSLAADPLLDRGYHEMYNLQFEEAHQTFAEFERTNPKNALGPVSDAAAYLFSEFDRMHILQSQFFVSNTGFLNFHRAPADPKVKHLFDAALDQTKTLAQAALAKSPDDVDAMFAIALQSGLKADYLALIEKSNLAALSEIKNGRLAAEKLLASHPDYYDAYIAAGVENYLLSLKPAPVRWLLNLGGAQSDKSAGIHDLEIVAQKGHYLLPYAKLLLAIAAIRDNDLAKAHNLLNWLSDHFPKNTLYQQELKKLK